VINLRGGRQVVCGCAGEKGREIAACISFFQIPKKKDRSFDCMNGFNLRGTGKIGSAIFMHGFGFFYIKVFIFLFQEQKKKHEQVSVNEPSFFLFLFFFFCSCDIDG
jgi:hypothetical protein